MAGNECSFQFSSPICWVQCHLTRDSDVTHKYQWHGILAMQEFPTSNPEVLGEWTPEHPRIYPYKIDVSKKKSTTKCQERHEPHICLVSISTRAFINIAGCNLQKKHQTNTESGWIMGPSPYISSWQLPGLVPASSSFLGCTWSIWPMLGSSAKIAENLFLDGSKQPNNQIAIWGNRTAYPKKKCEFFSNPKAGNGSLFFDCC